MLFTGIVMVSMTVTAVTFKVVEAMQVNAVSDAPSIEITRTITKETLPVTDAASAEAAQKAATADAQAKAEAASVAAAAATPAVSTPAPSSRALYNDTSTKTHMPAEIMGQPTALWLGEWTPNIQQYVNNVVTAATAQGTIPVFVAYNIPSRDLGSYSAGGAGSSENYRAWIRSIAAGIGAREAVVIVEPDALAQIDQLNAASQTRRYADLSDAVTVLATQTKAVIYLDAGHSAWIGADEMAKRLEKANVAQARGFSLNISNFQTTANNQAYGDKISAKIKKSYVIDTSRNGQGPKGSEWCNPAGRGLGAKPAIVNRGNLDAYLWIKTPGESDGDCGIGQPAAGQWFNDYALELIKNARY